MQLIAEGVTLVLSQVPVITPDPSGIPGMEALARLVSGLMFAALLVCVAGVFFGGITWATSSHSSPYGVVAGKRAVLVSAGAALLIGAAQALISFAFNMGQGVR